MGNKDNITVGSLVIAEAGRDKGSVFVAAEVRQGYLFIADGKRRKLEKPKRKNIKHISPVGDTHICLDGMTNKGLRKLLSLYQMNTEEAASDAAETTENLRKGD